MHLRSLGLLFSEWEAPTWRPAWLTGKAWFKVPSAIKVELKGKPSKYVSGKDVILHLIGKIGVDGALYKSLEFMGEGLAHLSMDDRLCISNMAIEAGAKNGIFMVDDTTREYMKGRVDREYKVFEPDSDAQYDETITIDLSSLKPTVAFPHLPENTKTIDQVGEVKIDQVVIGSCTNGRLEDMKAAAEILKGKKIAKDVRCIVIPATQTIYKECIKRGYMDIFIDAGCAVSTPTCGTVPRGIHGNPGRARKVRGHHQQKFYRQNGTQPFGSVSGQSVGSGSFGRNVKDNRPRGGNVKHESTRNGLQVRRQHRYRYNNPRQIS